MKKLYSLFFIIILTVAGLSSFASDVSDAKAEYTVTFTVVDNHGTAINDAIITFGGVTYLTGEYSFSVEENSYGYTVFRHGYIEQAEAFITVDGPEEINFVLTPVVEITYDEANEEIDYSWNQQIGTFDPSLIINGFPYNTDGGFIMLKLYDSDDNLLVFADVFDEFTIGSMNYHAGTSNRIGADFTGAQFNGNWGTRTVNDNASYGGSLRNTALNGALFYGVMVDATVGTVGLVAPTPSGSDSQTFAYSFTDGVYGDYYIVVEFHIPWRPLPAGTTDYYSFAEFDALVPYASFTIDFHLDSPEEIAIQHAIDNSGVIINEDNVEVVVGNDIVFNTTETFTAFDVALPAFYYDAVINFSENLPNGAVLSVNNSTLALTGNVTADGSSSAYLVSDILATPAPLISTKTSTIETITYTISNLPAEFSANASIQMMMDLDFVTPSDLYILGEDAVSISVIEDVIPFEITVQPVDITICDGTDGTLTITAAGPEQINYHWIHNGESVGNDPNVSTLIVTEAGDYYCNVLMEGAETLISETVTVTVIEVNPVLESEIEACTGTTVELDPGVFNEYEWQDLSTDQIYNVTTGGTYTVIVTGENGCTATASSVVTFFDEVEIAFEDTVNLCAGSSLTLTAPLGDSYEWGEGEDTQDIEVTEEGWYFLTVTIATCSGNDSTYVQIVDIPEAFDLGEDIYTCAATYTITGPEVTDLEYLWSNSETTQSIEVTETGTYTLTLLNENGCGISDEIMIEFGTEFEFSLYENDSIESCEGNTVTLETEIGESWSWSTGEETISIDVTDTDWYYLTVTSEVGCIGNDSVYVLFNTLPIINIGEDLQFCDGLNSELTAPESVSYLWNTGETTQSITIDTAGTYICTITDENACSNSDEMTLSILPSPNVDLGEDIIVDEDQVLIFGTQLGHPEYLWSTGATTDNIIVNASDLELGINTISVTVTGNNGCITTDDIIITVIPGASVEIENANSYSVYPNPSNGIININGNNIENINIYDCLGREIISSTLTQIDITNLSNGVYTIVIVGENQKYTTKLIKQ